LSKQIYGRPGTISAGDMASIAWRKEEYYNRPVKALWLRVFVVYARAERYGRINRASVMTVNESSNAPQSSMLKNLRLCMGQVGIVYDYGDGVDAEDAADLPRIPNTELTMKIAVIWVTFIREALPFTSN